jgi:hypothetical protein
MEHRWHPRDEIDSPVMVYQKEVGLIKATVRNISADGMLVDMGRFAMAKGTMVALAGAAISRFQGPLLQLRALIIHGNDGLAGLMFVGGRHNVAALRNDLEKYSGQEPYFPREEINATLESGDFRLAAAYASR